MKPLRAVTSLVVTAALLVTTPARASVFGEENAVLTGILAEAITQVQQMAQTFQTLKQTYDETKRYVGMVDDARRAFVDVQRFASVALEHPEQLIDTAFPDAAALRREVSAPTAWGQGTGELQRRISLCLGTGPAAGCTQVYERLRAQQVRQALSSTYGTLPADSRRDDIRATDSEAAAAIVNASAHEGKAAVSREQYKALLQQCTEAHDMAACQAAANMAAILQAQGVADVNEQLATANRLKAVELANTAAAGKREEAEAERRTKMMLDGFGDISRMHVLPAGQTEAEPSVHFVPAAPVGPK